MDFRTARLLGVRANRVIGSAVLISGLLAATVSVILTVQNPLVTPDFALRDTIIVLAGVVVGGMNRLLSATLGGFAIGFVSGLLGGALPTDQSQYLPSFVFGLVILVLLVRPNGPLRPRPGARGARVSGRQLVQLGGPAALVVAAALLGSVVVGLDRGLLHQCARRRLDRRRDLRLRRELGRAVVRPHQLRRGRRLGGGRALRARGREAGDHAVPVPVPPRPHAREHPLARSSPPASAALYALLVGLPLMRLSGLAAGIATFGVLEITHNLLRYYEKIGPGSNTFSSVPETTDLLQAALGALLVIGVAFGYQSEPLRPPAARHARGFAAARAVGVSVYRQRLDRVRALRACSRGSPAGLYVHLLPINTETVYLDLTFITLAMLVIGGMTSLWGAVVGALAVSGLDSLLAEAENGLDVGGLHDRSARRHAPRRRRHADGARC